MRVLDIEEDDVPAWYELSFHEAPAELHIRIHQDCAPQLPLLNRESPIIGDLLTDLEAKDFVGDFQPRFGFDGVLEYRGLNENWHNICATFPPKVLRSRSGDAEDYPAQHKLSRSLEVLFLQLGLYNGHTTATRPQLLTVGLAMKDQDFFQAFLEGRISKKLALWLARLGDGHVKFPGAVQTMLATYQRMHGPLAAYQKNDLNAWTDAGNLVLECFGNACDIGPDPGARSEVTSGYQFSSHNVNSTAQQLTLLAGLAAVHDLARQAGM